MSVQPGSAPQKKSLGAELLSLLRDFLVIALALALTQAYLFQFIRVDGTSMADTLKNGDILLVNKLDRNFQRGDVVICQYPGRLNAEINLNASLSLKIHTIFVKRLVALPGDTVAIRQGRLYVNGSLTEDPEHMASLPADYPRRVLGENEYFVIGDNRGRSNDSRSVGPITLDMLRGKVICVLWPLNAIRSVH